MRTDPDEPQDDAGRRPCADVGGTKTAPLHLQYPAPQTRPEGPGAVSPGPTPGDDASRRWTTCSLPRRDPRDFVCHGYVGRYTVSEVKLTGLDPSTAIVSIGSLNEVAW